MKSFYLFLLGFAVGFLFNHYVMNYDVYTSAFLGTVFGISYGLAYFLDQPKFKTPMRLAITFGAALAVYLAGSLAYPEGIALAAVISFFIIAFGYNLIASMFRGKSVRSR